MRFLFAADLHGNEFQYNKVFQYIHEQHIELLVLYIWVCCSVLFYGQHIKVLKRQTAKIF